MGWVWAGFTGKARGRRGGELVGSRVQIPAGGWVESRGSKVGRLGWFIGWVGWLVGGFDYLINGIR